jgi:hypothetical protein
MPVIPVNKVVDPKKNNRKKWRAEGEERHKGSLPPPQKKKFKKMYLVKKAPKRRKFGQSGHPVRQLFNGSDFRARSPRQNFERRLEPKKIPRNVFEDPFMLE